MGRAYQNPKLDNRTLDIGAEAWDIDPEHFAAKALELQSRGSRRPADR